LGVPVLIAHRRAFRCNSVPVASSFLLAMTGLAGFPLQTLTQNTGVTLDIMEEPSFSETLGAMEEKLRAQAKEYLEHDLPRIQAFENKNAIMLSKHGWYMSSRMMIGEFWGVLAQVRDGQIEEAQDTLLSHFRDHRRAIHSQLTSKHPDRSKVLAEAFDAHEKGMLFASTILFLSIADGLCNGKLMTKERRQYLDSQKSRVLTNAVLGVKSAIDAHSSQKPKYFSDLNRHEVMHGMDSNYGTEVNSYKALSLLAFISDFVGDLNEWDLYGTGPAL